MEDFVIEIRLMRYVLAIARYASFTKAAESLNLAQPSLSQQIRRLEAGLGAPLFFRDPRRVVPTSLGSQFIERAQAILVLHDDLVNEVKDERQHRSATLTLGAPSITGGHLLPPWLLRYRIKFPEIKVRLIEESPEKLEELTERGVTDLSVLALPLRGIQFETYPILTEGIVLALPAAFAPWMPLNWRPWYPVPPALEREPRVVSLEVTSDVPFILLKEGYGFRQTVLSLCATCGFQPNIAFETANIETAQSLAAHGHGVTLVPEMVMIQGPGHVPRYMRLAQAPTRTLVLARRKDRYLSRAAREFIALRPDPDDGGRTLTSFYDAP